MIYLDTFIFIIAEEDCGRIQVSAGSDSYESFYGIYSLSEDKSAPNNPVWKQKAGNFYIFNTGNSDGLRIGKEERIKTGQSYYYSKKYKFNYIK